MQPLHTTRAIVLRSIRHGDRSLIVKTFTELFGSRSYLVRTGTKGGVRPGLLEPLARLELVVTDSADHELQHLREARSDRPYVRLAVDPVRGTLALFTQEVLHHCLGQHGPDPALFRSVLAALETLDTADEITCYPQFLLLQLAGHMGFLPSAGGEDDRWFDPIEGVFLNAPAPHVHGFDEDLSAALQRMILGWPLMPEKQELPTATRRALLDGLLAFFRFHVPGFGELRSPGILHAVLH